MAGDLELAARVFGTKELVAGLSELQQDMRRRLFFSLRDLAKAYAADVMSSGLAEQGIKSRTGRLAGSMRTPSKLTAEAARVLIYPNATDPRTKYRYPWALGKGSPKSEIMVKGHTRQAHDLNTYASQRRRVGGKRGVAQAVAVQTASGVQFVKAHRRRVRLRPRPFMSGSAFTRLQATFSARMEEAIRQAIQDAQLVASSTASEWRDSEVY